MSFDPLAFSTSFNKTIGSMVSGTASGLTSGGINDYVSNLTGSGLSLGSLKNLAANKLDETTNFLNGDPSFSRISMQNLALNRSTLAETDPNSVILSSNKDQLPSYDRYPKSLTSDFIRIEFAKYERPGPLAKVNFNTTYYADLPLPRDLTETHSVRLNPQETGLLTAITSKIGEIGQVINTPADQLDLKKIASQDLGFMYQAGSTLARPVLDLIQKTTGISSEQVLGRIGQELGAIPNPHISVFFNGVDIRPAMEFSWLLSARSAEESAIIRNIVRQFKRRALPTVSQGDQNVMSYPQMVKLSLYPWNNTEKPNNWSGTMPIYKVGLIDSITINYSPNGLAFFNDAQSSPVFVVFTFRFQELEVWTGSDYMDPASGIDINQAISQQGAISDSGENSTIGYKKSDENKKLQETMKLFGGE